MANDTNQDSEENSNPKIPHPAWLLFACIFVISTWIFNLCYGLTFTAEEKGQFGDQFGAANALFSGLALALALAGLVYAIIMQRFETKVAQETLKTAQDELRNTKQLIDDQKQALDIQNKAAQQQAFESRLFKLLDNYLQIRDGVEYKDRKGARRIKFLANNLMNYSAIKEAPKDEQERPNKISEFNEQYKNNFYKKNAAYLGQYFRSFFVAFDFIDKSQKSEDDKQSYAKLMRAYISDHECGLLLANAYSDYGEKSKPLILKYKIANNIPRQYYNNLLFQQYLKDTNQLDKEKFKVLLDIKPNQNVSGEEYFKDWFPG